MVEEGQNALESRGSVKLCSVELVGQLEVGGHKMGVLQKRPEVKSSG